MPKRVCPYWVGYILASPLRRLLHNPDRILASLVGSGMTVLEVGPAMGFFTLPIARMVGPDGQVVCVDLQEKMLQALRKRAAAVRLSDRVVARVCQSSSLGVEEFAGRIDFVLAFAVVHELPDTLHFFVEVSDVLRPAGRCLVAEPKGHVSLQEFEAVLAAAAQAGLRVMQRPDIVRCRAAFLTKEDPGHC
jgi:ubiquinone/menaquinone biosynthesis C-methylase UbiE